MFLLYTQSVSDSLEFLDLNFQGTWQQHASKKFEHLTISTIKRGWGLCGLFAITRKHLWRLSWCRNSRNWTHLRHLRHCIHGRVCEEHWKNHTDARCCTSRDLSPLFIRLAFYVQRRRTCEFCLSAENRRKRHNLCVGGEVRMEWKKERQNKWKAKGECIIKQPWRSGVITRLGL